MLKGDKLSAGDKANDGGRGHRARQNEGKKRYELRKIYLSTGVISSKTGNSGLHYFDFQKFPVRDVIRVRHSLVCLLEPVDDCCRTTMEMGSNAYYIRE